MKSAAEQKASLNRSKSDWVFLLGPSVVTILVTSIVLLVVLNMSI
jgi:hypothetical protein